MTGKGEMPKSNSLVGFPFNPCTSRSTRVINNIAMAKTFYGVRRLILLTRFIPSRPSYTLCRGENVNNMVCNKITWN